MDVSHSTFSGSLCFILHCLIASAGYSTKPGHIHLWIMHFVRGVLPFAREREGGRWDCHWGICLGLHLSAATDETPMLSISQLSVTSLPRNEWWYIGMISHERFQSCHIYSTLEGTFSLLNCSQCVCQAGVKAEIVGHFLCLREVTDSAFHVPN